jgi:BlaR1 peptidase M56
MIGSAIASFNLNAIARTLAVQIVDCLVEGTLIAIFAGSLLGVARRQNSDTRFAVWFSALIAIAALPVFGGSWWSHEPATGEQSGITVPASWALYLFGAWAAAASWSLLGIGRGLWHLHVLRKSCAPVNPAELDMRLQKTLEGKSARRVTLCTSDLVRVPTAIGLVKPVIAMPHWAMQELSPDELNQVLLHELAHLSRWDDWTNLAQKVVKALFFFHPAVWWIEKKVSLEREMACDDAVIAETASPRAYAECLTRLAERTLVQRSMALAQAALGRIRQTSLRVAQILDVNRPTNAGRAWKPAVLLVAGFAMVCVFGISRAPRPVAFRDDGTSAVASPMVAGVSKADSERVSTAKPIERLSQVRAKFQTHPVRIVPARLKAPVRRSFNSYERAAVMRSRNVRPNTASMVREANVRMADADATPVAFTGTLFVVIQGRANDSLDQPVYQIQLWRVMILHPVVDPHSDRIPAKQT